MKSERRERLELVGGAVVALGYLAVAVVVFLLLLDMQGDGRLDCQGGPQVGCDSTEPAPVVDDDGYDVSDDYQRQVSEADAQYADDLYDSVQNEAPYVGGP